MATPRQILKLLRHVYDSVGSGAIRRVVPNLVGHAGMGKTQVVEQFGREVIGDYEPLHLGALDSPGDLRGMPDIREIDGDLVTIEARPHWFPDQRNRPIGVFHVDEPNRANPLVAPILYDFLIYGRVGRHVLPPGWMIVCTSNPVTDEYSVTEMDKALMSRLLHVPVSVTPGEWLEGYAIPRGISPDIQDLIAQDGSLLGVETVSLPPAKPSPRSWELFNILYKPGMSRTLLSLIADGLFGSTVGGSIVTMLTRVMKPISSVDILDHYGRVREWVQVFGSVRYARLDVLRLTVDALNRCALTRNADRLQNLQRFIVDLPDDMKVGVTLWNRWLRA